MHLLFLFGRICKTFGMVDWSTRDGVHFINIQASFDKRYRYEGIHNLHSAATILEKKGPLPRGSWAFGP